MNQYWLKTLFVPLFAAALVSCPTDTSASIKITGIDASATPATITSSATSSLTATVSGTGAFSPAVNWSIVSGGGSLSATTGANVTYTAPSVTSSTTVQVKATAAGEVSVSKTVAVTVQPVTATPKPMINSFSATPSSLTAAGQVTLIWDVSNATSLSVDSDVGAVTGTSKVVSVASSTTFTLTATNASGSSTSTATVTVASQPAPPTVVSVSPANGATGVSADAKIVVTFSQPMDQAATQAAYQSADLPAGGVTFDWNAAATEMTVKPNAPLEYAKGTTLNTAPKSYEFKLTNSAKDKTGIALAPLNLSFATLRIITFTLTTDDQSTGSVYFNRTLLLVDSFYVGDTIEDLGVRTFLSFNLPDVPASSSSNLQSAKLSLYKLKVVGSPFEVLGSCVPVPPRSLCPTSVPVNLDLVSYGPSVGSESYYALTLLALKIDNFRLAINTRVEADVLTAVRYNLVNREPRSQYRLSFPRFTNSDKQEDTVRYSIDTPNNPLLVLEYLIP